jgi:hypothetical protein
MELVRRTAASCSPSWREVRTRVEIGMSDDLGERSDSAAPQLEHEADARFGRFYTAWVNNGRGITRLSASGEPSKGDTLGAQPSELESIRHAAVLTEMTSAYSPAQIVVSWVAAEASARFNQRERSVSTIDPGLLSRLWRAPIRSSYQRPAQRQEMSPVDNSGARCISSASL